MTTRFGFSLQGRGLLAQREPLSELARRADALDYDSIWVTERLAIPVQSETPYPYSPTGAFPLGPDEPWLEALTALTYLATITERIQVGTSILVVPYRNPIFTAKALATADYLSGGRIILGAGAGWWREEFAVLGIPFEERGPRTWEYLRVMKEMWTKPRFSFQGRFVQADEMGGVQPHPTRKPHIPIWIAGHSDGALRRLVELGDAWHPIGLRPPIYFHPPELAEKVRKIRELAEQAGRDPATITITFKAPLRFGEATDGERPLLSGTPAQIVEDLQAYIATGVQHFVFDFSVATLPEMLDVLERFATEVRPHVEPQASAQSARA